MLHEESKTFARDLRSLFNEGTCVGLSDKQLLERFVTLGGQEAESAFSAIMERHGPMVLRTCLSVEQHDQNAQDAFQATFFILARRARWLWVRDSLGPWLHRVAYRVAVRSRVATAKRKEVELEGASLTTKSMADPPYLEFYPILHEELDRLPDRYRAPIVLCDLEERTHEEAATRLRCPIGTVKSRLSRGRERLRSRLVRRGLAPLVGSLGASFSSEAISAEIPHPLMETTIRVATRFLAERGIISASIGALIERTLMSMFLARIKALAATIVVVGVTTAAVGLVVSGYLLAEDRPTTSTPKEKAQGKSAGSNPRREELVPLDSDGALTVAFAPDGKSVAEAGFGGTIRLWDTTTGELRAEFEGSKRTVRSVCFASNGKILASSSDDLVIRLWSPSTGALIRTLPGLSESLPQSAPTALVTSIGLSPDGTSIALAGLVPSKRELKEHNYDIRLLDLDTGKIKWAHMGRGDSVMSLSFSPDGKSLATAGYFTVRIWDAQTGDLKATMPPTRHLIRKIAFSADSESLIEGGGNFSQGGGGASTSQVTMWDLSTGKVQKKVPAHLGPVLAIATSPDGRLIASGGSSGRTKDGTIEISGQVHPVRKSVSEIKLWDAATGQLIRTLDGDSGDVSSIAFSPDSQSLVFCDSSTVTLIKVETGEVERVLKRTTLKQREAQKVAPPTATPGNSETNARTKDTPGN